MDEEIKHIGDLIIDDEGKRWLVSSINFAQGKVTYGKVLEGSLAANVLLDRLKALSEQE